MNDLLHRRTEELHALNDIGKAITSTLDLQEILRVIMEKVSRLLRPRAWSLLMIDEATDDLVFEIAVSPAAELLKGIRLKKGEGIAGWVAVHGDPLFIADVLEDDRFAQKIDQVTDYTTRSVVCSKSHLGVIEIINSLDDVRAPRREQTPVRTRAPDRRSYPKN